MTGFYFTVLQKMTKKFQFYYLIAKIIQKSCNEKNSKSFKILW